MTRDEAEATLRAHRATPIGPGERDRSALRALAAITPEYAEQAAARAESRSDMPVPRPYDHRIPERNPMGRRCFEQLAGWLTGVVIVACSVSGCGPVDLNNAPLTPVPAPAVTR
jgi:hypothetical protein